MKRFMPLIIFAILAIILADRLMIPRVTGTIDSPLIGKPLPDLAIADLPQGPFILNFFASWCAPCAVEHPHLMKLKKDGVTIVGIAFHDTPENITAWLKKHNNPYKTVKYDSGDNAGIVMGITGVPESFAVDAGHVVRLRQQGPLEDPNVIADFLKVVKP